MKKVAKHLRLTSIKDLNLVADTYENFIAQNISAPNALRLTADKLNLTDEQEVLDFLDERDNLEND